MPIQVSYMGTKRPIAPSVAAIICKAPPGPLLDLFSGICAIGSVVAPSRQIWCNDIQLFASAVAEAFFCSSEFPLHPDRVVDLAYGHYRENREPLEKRFRKQIAAEQTALAARTYRLVRRSQESIAEQTLALSRVRERRRLAAAPREGPWRLFAITFAGGYLGLIQCIDVDSIRFSIDHLRAAKKIGEHQHRWLCLALCEAVSKVATTTGHFAQFMSVKTATLDRFAAQRSRSVWAEWLRAIHDFAPVGTPNWRSKNRVFRSEATALLRRLRHTTDRPAVIYADPPYTDDQYSRFYHLYETLLQYDYPDAEGRGRYRPDRFSSKFSMRTCVSGAIQELIERSADLGASLVLSYPENGLLPDAEETIRSLIKQNYGKAPRVTSLAHNHSSLGSSKGRQKYAVRELIFAAG